MAQKGRKREKEGEMGRSALRCVQTQRNKRTRAGGASPQHNAKTKLPIELSSGPHQNQKNKSVHNCVPAQQKSAAVWVCGIPRTERSTKPNVPRRPRENQRRETLTIRRRRSKQLGESGTEENDRGKKNGRKKRAHAQNNKQFAECRTKGRAP